MKSVKKSLFFLINILISVIFVFLFPSATHADLSNPEGCGCLCVWYNQQIPALNNETRDVSIILEKTDSASACDHACDVYGTNMGYGQVGPGTIPNTSCPQGSDPNCGYNGRSFWDNDCPEPLFTTSSNFDGGCPPIFATGERIDGQIGTKIGYEQNPANDLWSVWIDFPPAAINELDARNSIIVITYSDGSNPRKAYTTARDLEENNFRFYLFPNEIWGMGEVPFGNPAEIESMAMGVTINHVVISNSALKTHEGYDTFYTIDEFNRASIRSGSLESKLIATTDWGCYDPAICPGFDCNCDIRSINPRLGTDGCVLSTLDGYNVATLEKTDQDPIAQFGVENPFYYDVCAQIPENNPTARDACCKCATGILESTFSSARGGCTKVDDMVDHGGMYTAIGCISNDPVKIIQSFTYVGLSLMGGILLLIILTAALLLTTSQGDPQQVSKAKEILTSGIIGTMFIIFSVVILRFVAADLLRIPGFGQN